MRDIVLSLFDYTGVAVQPWVNAGFKAYCFDIQHETEATVLNKQTGGALHKRGLDLYDQKNLAALVQEFKGRVAFIFGFPPCQSLAVSGALHFASKRAKDPDFQVRAAGHAMAVADLAEKIGSPFLIENPVSVLSTIWRKPNYKFHPYQYGGYIPADKASHPQWPDHIAPRDAYSKKTCLWTGGGFIMPAPLPVACESFGASRQHQKLGGKSLKTKNIRSATPRGFSQAVFEANGININEDFCPATALAKALFSFTPQAAE